MSDGKTPENPVQACGEKPEPPKVPVTAHIAVRALDADDGTPIKQAAVGASGPDSRSDPSNDSGDVLFKDVSPGNYTVLASHRSYADNSSKGSVPAGNTCR